MVSEVNIEKIMPKVVASLDKLLSKTDFDSLTVKSIAEEMGISRQYFYRAFADKYALIVDLFEYDLKRGLEIFFSPRFCYLHTLSYILENRKIYKSILSSTYGKYLYDVMYNYGIELVRAMAEYMSVRSFTKEQDNRLRLYFAGVTSMLSRTITGTEHFTKEELDRIFYDNIPSFVSFLKGETVTRDYILYKIMKYREGHIV
ncbi:MAG: TetR family transcriptional regulator [Clostridia bacterium]|nr:TetR family transcriptional regulator [Clostridia bacterium]